MNELAETTQTGWTQKQVELIKTQIAKDADNDELEMFLYHCKKTGLDPLSKQIYFQKRLDKKGKPNVIFITSIDGFRLIAARTGEHAGTDDTIFDNEKEPNKATTTVYRIVKGQRVAFTASARWNEYCPLPPLDFMWQKMPCTMLGKCSEGLALRKAFPNELGNMYTKEEMDQVDAEPTRVINNSPAAPKVSTVAAVIPHQPAVEITDKQRKMIWARIKKLELSDDEAKAFFQSHSGKESSKDWTRADFEKVLNAIEVLENKQTIPMPGDDWMPEGIK